MDSYDEGEWNWADEEKLQRLLNEQREILSKSQSMHEENERLRAVAQTWKVILVCLY